MQGTQIQLNCPVLPVFAATRKHLDSNFAMAFFPKGHNISTVHVHSHQIPNDQRLDHASFGYKVNSEQDLDKRKVYVYSVSQHPRIPLLSCCTSHLDLQLVVLEHEKPFTSLLKHFQTFQSDN